MTVVAAGSGHSGQQRAGQGAQAQRQGQGDKGSIILFLSSDSIEEITYI